MVKVKGKPRKIQKSKKKVKKVSRMGGVRDGLIFEQIYKPENNEHKFLISDPAGNIREDDRFQVTPNLVYVPWASSAVEEGSILLPTEARKYLSVNRLKEKTRKLIHKYLDITGQAEEIATDYIHLSWCSEFFNNLPYFRVMGASGCGKTTAINVIGALCCRPIRSDAASTPAILFRLIDLTRGTLIIDEAQFDKRTEMGQAITQILNAGIAKNRVLWRSHPTTRVPEPYALHSAKILATRKSFDDDALERRCVSFLMQETTRKIPDELDEFYPEAINIRCQWLMWRLKEARNVKLKQGLREVPGIKPAIRQIVKPLHSLGNEGFYVSYIKTLNEKLVNLRQQTNQSKVLSTIISLYQRKPLPQYFTVGEIAQELRVIYGLEEKVFTSRKCGEIIRSMDFSTSKKDRGYVFEMDIQKIRRWAITLGLRNEAEKAFPELSKQKRLVARVVRKKND